MKVDVEDLAVAAPVAAEVEDDAFVFGLACFRAEAISALGSASAE